MPLWPERAPRGPPASRKGTAAPPTGFPEVSALEKALACAACVIPPSGSGAPALGQAVGVKEVDNGIWLVSFMDYDLGYIDLEEKTALHQKWGRMTS